MTRWVVAVGAAVTVAVFWLSGHPTAGAVAGVAGLWLASRGGRRQAGEDRSFSTDQRRAIFVRDGGRCSYCGVPIHFEMHCARGGCSACYECDHVVAWSNGGPTSLVNAAAACRICNRSKADDSLEEWTRRRGL